MRLRVLTGVGLTMAAMLALLPRGADAITTTRYEPTVVREVTGLGRFANISGVDDAGWIAGSAWDGQVHQLITGTVEQPVFTPVDGYHGWPRVNASGTAVVMKEEEDGRSHPVWVGADGSLVIPDLPADMEIAVAGIADDGSVGATMHSSDPSCQPGHNFNCPVWVVEIRPDGTITELEEFPTGTFAVVIGHDGEWTVGYAVYQRPTRVVPIRWGADGTRTELALPAGWIAGMAIDVNEAGEVIGYGSQTPSLGGAPLRWRRDGMVERLDTAGSYAEVLGISDTGDVVGVLGGYGSGERWPGLWRKGSTAVTDVRTLMGKCSMALTPYDIAADGTIVGTAAADGDRHQAVVLKARSILQPLGSSCHGVAGTPLASPLSTSTPLDDVLEQFRTD